MKKPGTNKLLIRLTIVATGTIAIVLFADSCESTNSYLQAQQIVFPDSGVSYHQHVQPMFDISCTYSGCHDDYTKAGGLSLTTWSNTNADPGNVVPGNPDFSKLCRVLERTQIHLSPLDTIQNHIKGIRKWVLEGGRNN